MELNKPSQNEQQLKNFDLSEYRYNIEICYAWENNLVIANFGWFWSCRQVIYSSIIVAYEQIVKQIQDILKVFIVPAILDHDETARGKQKGIDLFRWKDVVHNNS